MVSAHDCTALLARTATTTTAAAAAAAAAAGAGGEPGLGAAGLRLLLVRRLRRHERL